MTPPRLAQATVGIVGLGLMGGSVGLALRERCDRRIGWDEHPDAGAQAQSVGAVDEAATSLEELAAASDIVVLAVPVDAIVQLSARLGPVLRHGSLLTDVGSTKSDVVAAFEAVPEGVDAVGGHPMCGRERGGIGAASSELLGGATWVLTRGQRSVSEPGWALLTELVRATGATPLELRAEEHDRAAAVASHLPFVTAHALVACLASAPTPATQLVATGFRDTTRLAGGSVEMWHAILRSNAVNVGAAIDGLVAELTTLRGALEGDADALRERLEAGRSARAALE